MNFFLLAINCKLYLCGVFVRLALLVWLKFYDSLYGIVMYSQILSDSICCISD